MLKKCKVDMYCILLILFSLTQLVSCTTPGAVEKTKTAVDSPPIEIVKIKPLYYTERNETDNVDSPAFWHGPNGEHWLIATAKSTDVMLVYDALNGQLLHRLGGSGAEPGQYDRPNGVSVIDDYMLVVERNNKRVQVQHLPDFETVGFIGADVLRRPYGLTVFKTSDSGYIIYVTDNYETPDEQIPPPEELGERIRQWQFTIAAGKLEARLIRSFGETEGSGILPKVESIWADPAHNRLLVADEQNVDIKIFDLEGNFTGEILGAGLFKYEPEGIVLFECPDGAGYWICTDQSYDDNTFHLFDRETLKHLGAFAGIGIENTDGICLTQAAFGDYPLGMFAAVHDDGNVGTIDLREIEKMENVDLNCHPK